MVEPTGKRSADQPETSRVVSEGVENAREALRRLVDREPERHPLVIALAAPLGTPLEPIQQGLRDSLRRFGYEVEVVHLSHLLDDIPYRPWGDLPSRGDRDYYVRRMDAGDELRGAVGDGSALAALAIADIASNRDEAPDNTAYILRSLKHPDEVSLLRHVYGDAFSLVAVASSAEERRDNLAETLSLFENPRSEAEKLIARDEADALQREYGQNVRDVYATADFYLPSGRGLEAIHEIDRFVDCLFGAPFSSPRLEEEGMRLAFDASLRSTAIGRQVGSALIPRLGTPVVVGTNEVPKPGGGQYWSGDVPDYRDFQTGVDPNPLYTKRVVQELLERLATHRWLIEELQGLSGHELLERAAGSEGESLLSGARASALIEFTRCLHAEQAAIINAARAGVATDGALLFSTTFPCHECAKMIVGAGIIEVYYIEPYPKSLVGRLYRDVIDTAPPLQADRGLVGGKVPFRPFVGVAPRRYESAFVAGERRIGSEIAAFDRLTACPRTGGWSKTGVQEREAVAVASIVRVLEGLAASLGDAAVTEPRSSVTSGADAQQTDETTAASEGATSGPG